MARGQLRIDDDEPWCVWATRTDAPPWRGLPSVPKYGDVRDAPDGRPVVGEWRPCVCGAPQATSAGPSVAGLTRRISWLRVLFGRPIFGPTWVITPVERARSDGHVATAFVRNLTQVGLWQASPDPSVTGSWELDDGLGPPRRLRLDADGSVEGDMKAVWGVHDGALVIDPSPRGDRTPRLVHVYVLSEDRRTFDGPLLFPGSTNHAAHGRKIE
jgi:hypothetical protein